jgi:hypothetical protein
LERNKLLSSVASASFQETKKSHSHNLKSQDGVCLNSAKSSISNKHHLVITIVAAEIRLLERKKNKGADEINNSNNSNNPIQQTQMLDPTLFLLR